MNKLEFVKTCVVSGYASQKNALKYAKGKDEFTSADLQNVFRINERQSDVKNRRVGFHGKISGDKLLDALGDDPEPWNHAFDASRGVKRSFITERMVLDDEDN